MNSRLALLKKRYEQLTTRERFFVLGLGWAFSYAFFHFFLFRPIANRHANLVIEVKENKKKINTLNTQIDAVKKIASSPLYKKWLQQKQVSLDIRDKYQNLLQTFSVNQWQNIINTVLQTNNNVRLIQIKNFPETAVAPLFIYNNKNNSKIYQRQLSLVIYSQFLDTVNYMVRLEKAFPNIHWNSLDYQVIQYPVAKVEMELAVYYEKNE